MTTTMPQTAPTATTRTPATEALRLLVDDVLLSVAADDADRYAGDTPAGRALLSLATLARRAVAALGAEPAIALAGAPGIEVQREFAAAARLLGEAAEAARGEPWEIADVLVRAERVQAQLPASRG
jgi:hypothetical protein